MNDYLPPGAPAPNRPAPPQRKGLFAAIASAGLFLLTKLKFLLVGLKFGKFLTTGWTMLLMVWTYSLFYGWKFAAGLVLMILLHELGHGAAARVVGLQVGAPVFIPFVGAFIALKEKPRSTYEHFIIGAGGPIAGSLAGAVCFAAAGQVDDATAGLLRTIGYFTLVMNLFNLIPFAGLDGARMTEAVKPVAGVIGAIGLVGALFFFGDHSAHWNTIALLVTVLAAVRFGMKWWTSRGTGGVVQLTAAPVAEESVTDDQRGTAALTYFVLAASLIAAVHVLQKSLPTVPMAH